MDIANLSTALSTSRLQTQISVAMLSKSMETTETISNSMVKMMEQSVQPYLGQHVDINV